MSVDTDLSIPQQFSDLDHANEEDLVPALLGEQSGDINFASSGAGANIKEQVGQTCLHVAAITGCHGTVESLLNKGARINAVDRQGFTAVHLSVLENQNETTLCLIKRGANLNQPDNKGNLPLHHAVRKGNGLLVTSLIEAGSKKDALNGRFDSPLHIATNLGQVETIKLLLQLGCDVNVTNADGATPLHILVTSSVNPSQFRTILECLLHAGCNINKQAYNTLETPLYKAIISEKEQFAEILLVYGANPNLSSPFGITALQFSFTNQFDQVVIMLLHCGIKWKRECWLQHHIGSKTLDTGALIDVILSWKNKPVTLLDQSRITLRNFYQEKLFYAIDDLSFVPKPVKDFLLLRDLLHPDVAHVCVAIGSKKFKWAELGSEEITDVPEMRKNEDEDICDE